MECCLSVCKLQTASSDIRGDTTDYTNILNMMSPCAADMMLPERVGLNMRIVMEYCEYGTLCDYLRPPKNSNFEPMNNILPLNIARGNGMDLTLCAEMTALDIARGLRLLHKCRMVHGDLKPQNILIAADTEVCIRCHYLRVHRKPHVLVLGRCDHASFHFSTRHR